MAAQHLEKCPTCSGAGSVTVPDSASVAPTAPVPPVPQMRTEVTGRTFGGQYWQEAVHEVTLDVVDDEAGRSYVLNLLGALGHSVHRIEMSPTQAATLREVCARTSGRDLVPGVPGLANRAAWEIGDDSDYVSLRADDLAEISEWLADALGEKKWDYAQNGDEWEY